MPHASPDSAAPGHPRSLESLRARYGEGYRWRALAAMACGMVAAVLSATIFNVAAPSLMADFHLGQDQVQWAVTAYMAAMTIAMLPVAWLVDRYGFRRVFLVAVLLLAVGSLGGALAPGFAAVVAMRILQGAAAGILQPMSTLLVLRHFPVDRQGRAMGILSFGIVLAPAVAPILGGLLVDHFGWRAIFLITLPGCAAALWSGLALLPVRAPTPALHRFDWRGLALLTLAILTLLQTVGGLHAHGLVSWPSAGGAALTVVALLAFAVHARRVPGPLLQLSLFRQRAFAMGAVVSFIYGLGLFGSTYLIPVFLQTVLAYNATTAGFALFPAGIALALVTPGAGHLADKVPAHRQTALGLLLFTLSFLALAWLALGRGQGDIPLLPALMAAVVLGRVGLALILPALNLGALRGLEAAQVGQGSGLVSCVRQVGGAVGVGLGAVYVEWRSSSLGIGGGGQAFAEVFLIVAVTFFLAMAAALGMVQPQRRKPPFDC
ncbi:MAG TPA: DHA2 family efflux MFS transporter permease subunit [Azospira sp.]|nr:DHA2 family efflux MFS transporter permease subunit [Azospira sp.]